MNFSSHIREWLHDPRVRGVDVDDEEFLSVHLEILSEKKLLSSTFKTFYQDMVKLCDKLLNVQGTEIELGSGVGFFKKIRPELVTSDVRKGEHIDIVLNAQDMSLPDNSVRCIYAINVFHHLSDPDLFFQELVRVLKVGGGCILAEPHIGFGSALIHRHLHSDECFEPEEGWQTTGIKGPLSGANQALSYIILERDIAIFRERYGDSLEIVHQGYALNSLRYLLSGGLNFRQLIPSMFEPVLRVLEFIGKPLAPHWALHQIIVIRRHK